MTLPNPLVFINDLLMGNKTVLHLLAKIVLKMGPVISLFFLFFIIIKI